GERANEIKKILENNKNLVETEGTLELIKIEGGINSHSFDVKIEFKNQDGKVFSYDETYTPSDSKASFLWKCENKGKVAVTVIYNKRNPNEHYIKELEELEVNENSKIFSIFCILYFDTIIFHIAKVGCTSRFNIYKFECTFQR
uniref:DUF3592 domain-containing protein n=1 Tax=uncultured Campylobacter sp. TaxID=218934 RepID=UPI002605B7D4